MSDSIRKMISDSIGAKQRLLADDRLTGDIARVAEVMTSAFRADGKVLWCGNGGSAADAQHIAAELSGRFSYDRPPLFSEALHVNTSYLTAVANDYGYDEVYARMTRAMGRKGDVLVGISTSGNSANVVRALEAARSIGIITVGFTGAKGGKMEALCDYLINVPSSETPRIQECHILIGHMLCAVIEQNLFPKS